jgi:hypothetical protein
LLVSLVMSTSQIARMAAHTPLIEQSAASASVSDLERHVDDVVEHGAQGQLQETWPVQDVQRDRGPGVSIGRNRNTPVTSA